MRAALTPGSAAGRLLAAAFAGQARLVGSPETLQEVARVLARSKFAARLPRSVVESFIARLIAETWVVEAEDRVTECRDPADNIVLEAASAAARELGDAAAVVIVSDDRDLLVLDAWRNIRIRVVKPEAALVLLGIE